MVNESLRVPPLLSPIRFHLRGAKAARPSGTAASKEAPGYPRGGKRGNQTTRVDLNTDAPTGIHAIAGPGLGPVRSRPAPGPAASSAGASCAALRSRARWPRARWPRRDGKAILAERPDSARPGRKIRPGPARRQSPAERLWIYLKTMGSVALATPSVILTVTESPPAGRDGSGLFLWRNFHLPRLSTVGVPISVSVTKSVSRSRCSR